MGDHRYDVFVTVRHGRLWWRWDENVLLHRDLTYDEATSILTTFAPHVGHGKRLANVGMRLSGPVPRGPDPMRRGM